MNATTAATANMPLVAEAIVRPDEPRHFMVIEQVHGTATATLGRTVIARSQAALLVREVGRHIYDPVLYFPPGDVRGDRLSPTGETTWCPLKGTAWQYHIVGNPQAKGSAWSYQQMEGFDRRLTALEGCVAFDPKTVTITTANEVSAPSHE